jgi:hypothetical protein
VYSLDFVSDRGVQFLGGNAEVGCASAVGHTARRLDGSAQSAPFVNGILDKFLNRKS